MDTPTPATDPLEPAEPRPIAGRAIWWEVLAVLMIVPIPFLWIKLTQQIYTAAAAEPDPSTYWFSLLNRCFYFVTWSYLTIFVMWRSGEPLKSFGLVRPRWRHLGLGLLIWIAVEVIVWLRRWLLPGQSFASLTGSFQSQTVVESVLLPVTLVLGAFIEELVFRAYLVTRLETLMNSAAWAVVCSAALFGFVHTGTVTMIETAIVGLTYAALFVKLREIWPFVLAHGLHNALVSLRGATL